MRSGGNILIVDWYHKPYSSEVLQNYHFIIHSNNKQLIFMNILNDIALEIPNPTFMKTTLTESKLS